ncbi:Terminal EAR1-like 1, putative isoform 2 [Hibiscus syriacus]|uniref:Terminal EAR1-like 1, putative isoform 2 n=1 Tax=Hibiscus syriacus TaxID=106335 RepID=A0A6A3CLC0_HIBSY|nr:protein terminal ear1 homolog [Hibiscus syriacus]KAE8730170.1 Terminal EAR1-like 1, putative isoform 2 [Hibiscus syriacus]
MAETGQLRFPGNLDPSAQEFWPATNVVCQPQFPICTPPQLYYPYAAASPTVPFCDVGVPPFHAVVPLHAPAPVTAPASYVAPQQSLPPPTAAATRALVLTLVPCDVSETELRKELEVFGEVRGVQMERVREGTVTVHFYDLRHAEKALKEIRDQHKQQQTRVGDQNIEASAGFEPFDPNARGLIAGKPVWAHFVIPASNAVPDGINQGTVVVFNLDPSVSISKLKDIFQAYGPVKELRETPLKKRQKFVEFYDVRDAAQALREMNGKEINGKQVVLQFSRPGGYSRKFFNGDINAFTYKYNHHTRNPKYPSPPPAAPPPPSFLAHRFFSMPTTKAMNSSNGNPTGNSNIKFSVVEMAAGVEDKVCSGGGGPKKTVKNQNNPLTVTSSDGSKQQLQQQCRGRPWKGRQAKKFDPQFLISEHAMVESNCKDSRTTVMIKNIPNKYSQKLLLNMLDNHCIHCNEQIAADGGNQPLSSYDFVYLPVDFNNKCNVGYGFVNMTSPQATWRLYKAFHHQHWEVFNSRKICEVTYARVQGLEALKEHFRNSKFPCEMDHYLPVVFSPPRDGKQLTEPLAIVGQKQQQSIVGGPSSAQFNGEGDDDDDNNNHSVDEV